MKSSPLLACAVAAALLMVSCVQTKPSTEVEAGASGAGFRDFVEGYFDSYFNFYPTQATSLGIHHYDGRLEPWSANRIQNRIYELKRQETSLEAIQRQQLSRDDAIDAEILLNRIRGEALDLETIRWWRRNPLMYAVIPGAAVDSMMKREFAPAKERLRAVIDRMKLIPGLLDDMRNNIAEVPTEFAEPALRVIRGSIPFFRDTVPVWAKSAAAGDAVLTNDFAAALRNLLASMEVTAEYLQRDVLFLATPGFSIGSSSFTKKLAFEEMVDVPLDRLLEIGEANLARDFAAFSDAARQVEGKSPADAMRSLAAQHPTEGNLVQFASSTAERVRQFVIDRKIIAVPSETRARIIASPPYLRASGFAFMDTPGPFETTAKEAFYYITPPEKEWSAERKQEHLRLFGRPVMDIITIHEAYPGHYVQFLYAKEFPTRTRKLVSCMTNAEGWAHYAEQMMVEQGFGEGDPKVKLAQLAEALVRDVRYVAAIKIHTQGMTTEQAKQLFMDKAFLEEGNAREEARRGVYDPMYLSYTLGKLQIYKLREDMEKQKGSAFTLSDFHTQFVRQGAIPLKMVRRILLPGDKAPAL